MNFRTNIALLFAVAVTACGSNDANQDKAAPAETDITVPPAPTDMIADANAGADNYEQLCAACHGAAGKGDGPVAEVLTTPAPDLTRIAARRGGEFPREELIRLIDGREQVDAHGSQQMPVWGYEFWIDAGGGAFSERKVAETLAALVDYIESIQVQP